MGWQRPLWKVIFRPRVNGWTLEPCPLSLDMFRTSAGKECLTFLGSYSPLSPPVHWVDSLSSSSFISLDKLLDAGLYTGEVTEIVGGPGSGKTQVHLRPAAGGHGVGKGRGEEGGGGG